MRFSYLVPVSLVALTIGGGLCARLSAQGFARAQLTAPAKNARSAQKSQSLARLVDYRRAQTSLTRASGAPVAGYTLVAALVWELRITAQSRTVKLR